jgi:biopolymer transport protein ExbD
MIYKTSFLSIVILFILVGCANNNQSDNATVDKTTSVKPTEQKTVTIDLNVIKVYVDKTGQITANGNPISLEALDSSFNKLKTTNGTVYYSRDDVQGEPPAESMKVMDLISKHSLSVMFYTDKTFTQPVKLN